MDSLHDKTIVITGSSRGIGREIALKCAKDGANIVIAAKSEDPHPKLGGSIHTVAEEIRALGAQVLAVQVDVRSEDDVGQMYDRAFKQFGSIDAVINNAGAISLTNVEETTVKKFDLLHSVNSRAVFICSQLALPYLKQSKNPHILSMCPPINLASRWLEPHAPYTLSKYGMTMLSLGMAKEFAWYGIAVNCLWPTTTIATSAIEFEMGGRAMMERSRRPAIMADAAYEILIKNAHEVTGQCFLDQEVLEQSGVDDFAQYMVVPNLNGTPQKDLFLD